MEPRWPQPRDRACSERDADQSRHRQPAVWQGTSASAASTRRHPQPSGPSSRSQRDTLSGVPARERTPRMGSRPHWRPHEPQLLCLHTRSSFLCRACGARARRTAPGAAARGSTPGKNRGRWAVRQSDGARPALGLARRLRCSESLIHDRQHLRRGATRLADLKDRTSKPSGGLTRVPAAWTAFAEGAALARECDAMALSERRVLPHLDRAHLPFVNPVRGWVERRSPPRQRSGGREAQRPVSEKLAVARHS